MKIGITGSLSSGKSSVAKILSKNNRLLFSADKVVKDKIGVRGLRKVLEKELRNIQYDIEEYHARNIKTVVVGYDANTNRLKTTFRYNRKNKTTKNK